MSSHTLLASRAPTPTIAETTRLEVLSMLWAAAYSQNLYPLGNDHFWTRALATVLAALPVVALFWFLVPRRWLAPKAAAAGAVVAILVAVLAYGMPADMAGMA